MQSKANRLLILVIVLQAFTLLGQWVSPSYTATASAQVPDAGAQRIQIIEAQRGTNQRLDRLIELLEGGKLQVRVVGGEKPATDR